MVGTHLWITIASKELVELMLACPGKESERMEPFNTKGTNER